MHHQVAKQSRDVRSFNGKDQSREGKKQRRIIKTQVHDQPVDHFEEELEEVMQVAEEGEKRR